METSGLVTPDMFHMAVIKAFLDRDPDSLDKITVSKFKQKAVATYSNRDGLPFLSQIKVTWGKKEISLDDFKMAFFEIKDKVFNEMKSEREDDGTDGKETPN